MHTVELNLKWDLPGGVLTTIPPSGAASPERRQTFVNIYRVLTCSERNYTLPPCRIGYATVVREIAQDLGLHEPYRNSLVCDITGNRTVNYH